MTEQVTLSQLIQHLQAQLDEHGDVGVYTTDYVRNKPIVIGGHMPRVFKIYKRESGNDALGHMYETDEELFDVDPTQPITKGLVL